MNISQKEASGEVAVIRRVTWIGFYVNAGLMALKLFFGYWGRSAALVADGYHSLSDFATDFIILIFIGVAYKKADSEHPYGHGKIETFSSMVIGVILFAVGLGIGAEGIVSAVRILGGETPAPPSIWALAVAVISIACKEWLFHYTMRAGKRVDSSSLRANAWHHRSDAISSVATLAGVGFSMLPGSVWRMADPLAAIVIAVFIAVSAVKIIKPSVEELLERSLPHSENVRIGRAIHSVEGVRHYHSLRTRRNGHSSIVDVDIHVDPDLSVAEGHRIASRVERRLHDLLGKDLITYIHIEPDRPEESRADN